MATLANFPMKNQRTAPAGPLDKDGKNDNPDFNCVGESFAAAIQYLTGRTVYGEELKDAEYGDLYKGGTALRVYVDQATDRARAVYGCNAEIFNSTDTSKLISQARTWLRQGYPVIATIPSAWGTAHTQAQLAKPSFSTHVVCFYTEDGTHMGAMNPWGGFLQAEPDAWWHDRLCYGQVWKVYKEDAVAILEIAGTNGYFTANKDGSWQCKNGRKVAGAILTDYRADDGLRRYGLPISDEVAVFPNDANKDKAAVRAQLFERGLRVADPKFLYDKPAGTPAGAQVYAGHIEQGNGFNLLTTALNKQLHDALVMVEDLKQHAADPAAVVLTPQQKEDLANMASLRATLASMLDGKAS